MAIVALAIFLGLLVLLFGFFVTALLVRRIRLGSSVYPTLESFIAGFSKDVGLAGERVGGPRFIARLEDTRFTGERGGRRVSITFARDEQPDWSGNHNERALVAIASPAARSSRCRSRDSRPKSRRRSA